MVDRCLARGEPFGVVLIRGGKEVGPLQRRHRPGRHHGRHPPGRTLPGRPLRHPDRRPAALPAGGRRQRLGALPRGAGPLPRGAHGLPRRGAPPGRAGGPAVPRVSPSCCSRRMTRARRSRSSSRSRWTMPIRRRIARRGRRMTTRPRRRPRARTRPWAPSRRPTSEAAQLKRRAARAEALARADGSLPFDRRRDAPRQRGRGRPLAGAATRAAPGRGAAPPRHRRPDGALLRADGPRPGRPGAHARRCSRRPTTTARLLDLDRLLARETWFLRQGLRPIIIDAAGLGRRVG